MSMVELGPAAQRMSDLIEGVPDRMLGEPTPCDEYTLGDLLDHVQSFARAFTAAARKDTAGMTAGRAPGDASRLGDDWRARIPRDLDALAESWRDPGAWTGMTKAGGIDLPGELAGLIALDELVVHGWDVARASGQDFELDGESLVPDRSEAHPSLEHRDEPARRLETEGRRHGLLQERPRRHRRRAVRADELRAAAREPVELVEHERGRPARDEHRGGVDDVLARRAEVNEIRRVSTDRLTECANQRLGRIADRTACPRELLDVVQLGATRIRDPRRGRVGNEPGAGPGPGERCLRVEHPLQPGEVADRVAQVLRDEDGRERRHTAKNVV